VLGRSEVEGVAFDGEQDECGRYVATNGVAYRW